MKYFDPHPVVPAATSSPARGMWIEMVFVRCARYRRLVIPRTGDVD